MMLINYLLVGLLFFEVVYFPDVPLVNYSDKLAWTLIFLLSGIHLIKEARYRERLGQIMESKQVGCLLGILLVSVMSIFFSKFTISKENYTSVKILLVNMAIFVYFASLELRIKQVRKMVKVISWLTLVVGVVSVISYLDNASVLKVIKMFFSDFSYRYFSYEFIRGRIAPIGGVAVSFLLPVSLMGKKFFKNIGWLVVFVLGCTAILLFNYRSYVISMLLGIVFYVFFMLTEQLNKKDSLMSIKLVIMGVLIVLVLGINLPVMQRFLFQDQDDMNNVFSRLSYMSLATDAFRARPIIGIGLGNFQKVANPLVALEKVNIRVLIKEPIYLSGNPHNQLLLWLSETGMIGGLVNLMLLVTFAVADIRYLIKTKVKEAIILVLMVVSWVFVVTSMLDATSINLFNMFYLIRGMLLSYSLSKK